MHRMLTIFGAAFVAVGLVLALVPLFDGPSKVLTPAQSDVGFNATTPFSVTGSWPVGLSWSSNQRVSLLVVVCHSVNQSASSLASVCPGASFTRMNGTAGTETFNVPLGGALLVGIISNLTSGLAVEVQLRPALTLIGTIVWVAGAGVVVVAVLARRSTRRPPLTKPDRPA